MILIAPDKFKGTYTAGQICQLVSTRLKAAGITKKLQLCPLSDGGEGIASIIAGESTKIGRGVYRRDGKYLVVSSEIIGVEAFAESGTPLHERSSIALGEAVVPGVPVEIAVGGTMTMDGGAGFLQGLGVRFYDKYNNEIGRGINPSNIKSIAKADLGSLNQYNLSGIIDVKAGLYEGELTAMDFARQKALPDEKIDDMADVLKHLQKILGGKSEWDGAGGGLGYALASVCGAKCCGGAEYVVSNLKIDWNQVDLVITGEGRVDRQTSLGGKLVDVICKEAARHGVPTLILYGIRDAGIEYPLMAQLNEDWPTMVKALVDGIDMESRG